MHRSDTLRLFVAIYPPPDAAAALVDSISRLTLPPHRLTPLTQVHVTLVFIGERRVKELRQVRESIERSASGIEPFDLTPQKLASIPTKEQGGDARMIWVATDAPPAALELQRRLATRLARPDERYKEFHPHLTVCRFQHGVTCDPIDQPIVLSPFRIERVKLMSSFIHAAGGVNHDVVAEFPLKA